MTLTAPAVAPGEGAMIFPIVDDDASRAQAKREALDLFIEYCATENHVPVGKPAYTFTPGTPSTVEVRARVKPAKRSWVAAVLERKN